MNKIRIFLAAQAIAAASACATSALAQSPAGLDWMRIKFSEHFNREPFDWSLTQVERQMGKVFDAGRIAGLDTISAQDAKLAEDIRLAQMRADAMRKVLANDIDGDGKVTRNEIRSVLRHKFSTMSTQHRAARMQREFDMIMRADRDRDGTITLDEIRRSVELQTALGMGPRTSYSSRHRPVPLDLDRDGDGVLTRDEFLQAVRTVFTEIDKDSDKQLGENEMTGFMSTIREVRLRQTRAQRSSYAATRLARQIANCSFPAMPDGAVPVFAAAYRGRGLANVTFKDSQQLLTVAEVHIEAGSDPVALILSAPSAMIWQITGAKDRVARVYLASRFQLGQKPDIAVSGVAAEKVHFMEGSACLPVRFSGDAERDHIVKALKAVTGREPASVVSLNMAGKVSFPSGKVEASAHNPQAVAAPKGSPGALFWDAATRSFPAGFVRFDPKTLVSQKPLTAAEVLPGRAGLAQLVDQGALEVPAAQGSGGKPALSLPLPELRIVAPIQMPAGLSRGIVRKFVLARDVKPPEGLASQVCVVSEADGKPVPGSAICR
ncbi:MAG: hypothetical protein AB7F96_12855 [Beijerinckiaceae bacterium]